ncbi:MAG: glycosyltransferase family 2 protein [Candidatus Omnitrophica bacterium]|nr:glycosyltransferase family 2 protein [Candidatus Omnitrophota bacterium]
MNAPRFSVILVNWNTAAMTCEAIRSVFAESSRSGVPVEVVVSDNGSDDESVTRIREAFPEVRVIENRANLGFSRAVNRALPQCHGEHVVLLNTDATLEEGALAAFVETFERAPKVGIQGASLLNPDGTPQNSSAPFPNLATELVPKWLLRALHPSVFESKVPPGSTEPREVDSVIGACLVIRGETLREIGPLDERFFFFLEETDWCFRARARGWKVVVNPGARVVHGQGKSSEKVLTDSRIEFHRSRYRYFRKNHGVLSAGCLFVGMILKLVVESLSAWTVVLASLGTSSRARRRARVVSALLAWHLLGCPKGWGLEGRFLL